MESKNMADENIKQVMQDAILDADSLEQFINGSDSETVLTRLSAKYPTLQNAISQINSKLDDADAQMKQAVIDLFKNGGLPATPFATKALMEASALVDGDYAMVTDDTDNNGLYVKTAGAWVKSDYDINAISKKISQKAIMEELDNYLSFSTNLFNPSSFVVGVSVSVTGDEQDSSTHGTTDYINVRDNTFVSFQSTIETAFFGLAAYDLDKVFTNSTKRVAYKKSQTRSLANSSNAFKNGIRRPQILDNKKPSVTRVVCI